MKRNDPQRLRQQRRNILEAAARFMAEHGYHGMTMRALAKETGKSLATAYNYFASKEEILFALQKEAFETLIAAGERALAGVESSSSRLYIFILQHVSYCSAHGDVMRVLVHEAGSLPPDRRRTIRRLKKRYFEIGRRLIEELLAEGCAPLAAPSQTALEAVEIERIAYSFFGMLNWIYGWYEPEIHGSPQELARTMHRLVLCGALTTCPMREIHDDMDAHFDSFISPPLLGTGEAVAPAAVEIGRR